MVSRVPSLLQISFLGVAWGLVAGHGLAKERSTGTPRAPVEVVSEPVDQGVVVLAPVEVKARRFAPDATLPRVKVPRSVNPGVETRDPFLTGAERERRLKKKHLSALDAVLLNRGNQPGAVHSAERRAAEAEKQQQFAEGMNQVADAIQLGAATGEDPKETKKLRALYRDLLMSKPR